MNRLVNFVILLASIIIGYYIHMNITSNIISNFIYINNALFGTLIFIVFIIIQIILVNLILKKTIILITQNKFLLTSNEQKLLWSIYFIVLFIAMFCRGHIILTKQYNLNPLTLFALSGTNISVSIWLLNLTMFIPLGFFNHNFKIQYFILTVFTTELFQVFLKVGIFDINDIILYISGFLIGKCLYKLYTN